MRTSMRVLGLLGVSLLAAACGVSNDDTGASTAAHTEGELVWSNVPYSWTEITQAEMDAAFEDKTAPSTHPIAVRLQAWVDRFDAEVRKVVEAKTGQKLVAPRPRVRLVVSAEVNAWIQSVPTCIASVDAPAAGAEPLLAFLRPNELARIEGDACVESRGWAPQGQRLGWLNELNAAYPTTDGLPSIVVRAEPHAIALDYGAIGPNALRAAKVAGVSAISLVNVNTALVSELDEKGAAVVLAHELGHYYRAHSSTATPDRYDFWFDRERALPERPVPVADQVKYKADYERLKLPRFAINGQRLHPRLGASLVAWATEMKLAPGHACEPVKDAVAKWPAAVRAELTAGGLGRELSGAARRAYLTIEEPMSKCIQTLALTNAPAGLDGFTDVQVPREWFVTRIREPLKSSLADVDLGSAATLSKLVERLTEKALALDAEGPEFLKRLEANQIGLYTAEQEADDISFELATRVGLTSKDVYGSQVQLMRWAERVASTSDFDTLNGSMSAAECEDLLAKGFKDGDDDVHVPLGTLEDTHHAFCYRIFNLYRENQAHHYKPATPSFPEGGPAWSELQQQARDLLEGKSTEPAEPTDPTKPTKPTKPTTSDPSESSEDGDWGASPDDYDSGEEDGTTPKKRSSSASQFACSAASGAASDGMAPLALTIAAALIASRRRRRS